MEGVGRFLDAVPADDLRAVRAAMRRRRFAKGEVIFHEGDPAETLHVIEQGHVAIRASTPLGDVATFTVIGPGDTFGELALLSADGVRSATAVALDRTETLSMGRALFAELRAKGPEVDRYLQALLAAQVARLSSHLVEALHSPADKRILRRLLEVAERYGDPDEGEVRVPLTQDDLASLAGTTRPTVNRLLKGLEAEGAVALTRGAITVTDGALVQRRAR